MTTIMRPRQSKSGAPKSVSDDDLRDLWASILRQLNALGYLAVDPFSLQIGVGVRGRQFMQRAQLGILPLKKLFIKAPKPPTPPKPPKSKKKGKTRRSSASSVTASSSASARYYYRGNVVNDRSRTKNYNSGYTYSSKSYDKYPRYDRF